MPCASLHSDPWLDLSVIALAAWAILVRVVRCTGILPAQQPLMTVSAGGPIINVAFSSDGMQIVSHSYGDDSNSVRVWDASTGMEKELKCYTELVDSFGFWSDGTHIVSISNDGSVQVWDSSTGVELKKLKGHTGLVDLFNLVVF